jgi:hypothetical protein
MGWGGKPAAGSLLKVAVGGTGVIAAVASEDGGVGEIVTVLPQAVSAIINMAALIFTKIEFRICICNLFSGHNGAAGIKRRQPDENTVYTSISRYTTI